MPVEASVGCLLQNGQTLSDPYPASYSMRTAVQPSGDEADSTPPSNVETVNEWNRASTALTYLRDSYMSNTLRLIQCHVIN